MNINLTPGLEKFVRDCADSSDYNNASEVVREALRNLKHRKEQDAIKLERLRQAVQEGKDAISRGDYIELKNDEELEEYFAKF